MTAEHEAGHIEEYHHREVEGVTEVNKVRVLFCREAIHRARLFQRIAPNHGYGVTVQTGEAGNQRAGPMSAHLKKLSIVHHVLDQVARVVTLPTVGGDDVEECLGATIGGIAGARAFCARPALPC